MTIPPESRPRSASSTPSSPAVSGLVDGTRVTSDPFGDAVYVLDGDTGSIVDANPAAVELHGYPLPELTRLGIVGISDGEPPYDGESALAWVGRAAAGEPVSLDWLTRHRSGARVWTEIRLRRVAVAGEERVVARVRDITARKEEEQAFRERERRFRLLIENSSDVATILDPEGVNRYQSPSVERVLGYRSDELLGTSMYAGIHPDDHEACRRALRAAAENPGSTRTVEFRFRHKDGSWRVLEAVGRTLLADSAAGGVIINSRDVTDHRRAEEALRKSEERFRSVVESSSDLITLMDGGGRVFYQSPAIGRTFGYSQQELIGSNGLDFVHPEDRVEVAAKLADAASHPGETRSAAFRFRHKDGHWIHVESVGATLSPTDPREGVVVSTRDITDRKRTELALREATRFLENLIASSPGVIFRGSGEPFRTAYISPNAEAVLGFSADRFLSDPRLWVERLHPDDRERVTASLAEARRRGDLDLVYEYRFLHASGEYRDMLASVRFERDPSTDSVEVLGYTFDVSRLKQTEAALREAKEAAERANRAKSEFLTRMSHELRTPMNSVLGFAQMLERAGLEPNQHRAVERIHDAGKHMLNLVNAVLDLARIEAGGEPLAPEPVQLAPLLQEALSLIRPLASQRNCRVPDLLPPDAQGYVLADRQRLTQVFLNLLSNAVKHNRPGGEVTLLVEVRGGSPPPGLVRVGVRDTGPGIPPERLDEVFLPFSHRGADHPEGEGMGLGLALSKTLVEAMGGRMSGESSVGEGSTFWVHLPRAIGPVEPAGSSGSGGREDQRPRVASRPATILYIEDDGANRTLIEEWFATDPEITLRSTSRGCLGIDLAREIEPDLILLDLQLPDLPGEQVLARLVDDPRTRSIPVVVISADATTRQIENLRASGAREYLTKPLDLDDLAGVLSRVLSEDLDPGGAAGGAAD